jgi:hypothetical protein
MRQPTRKVAFQFPAAGQPGPGSAGPYIRDPEPWLDGRDQDDPWLAARPGRRARPNDPAAPPELATATPSDVPDTIPPRAVTNACCDQRAEPPFCMRWFSFVLTGAATQNGSICVAGECPARDRVCKRSAVPVLVAGLQAVHKLGESDGQNGDGVVPFLVNVDDQWLPCEAAITVIERDHVVARRRAVREIHSDVGYPTPRSRSGCRGFRTANWGLPGRSRRCRGRRCDRSPKSSAPAWGSSPAWGFSRCDGASSRYRREGAGSRVLPGPTGSGHHRVRIRRTP